MTKIEWIRQQIADGITDFGVLNTPVLVPNPQSQGQVPKPIDIKEAFALVTPQEAFAISETRTYDRLLDAVKADRHDWVMDSIMVLVAGNVMSQSSATAIETLLQETIPDPNWQAEVYLTPAQQAGFDIVSVQDWEAAKAV